jgi:putative endonuclease
MILFYVYLLASCKNGYHYIGVTNNLIGRVRKHKNNTLDGFAKNRGIHNLVYYEEFTDIRKAIAREKQLKKWKSQWKIKLIEKDNFEWKDLYSNLCHSRESAALRPLQGKDDSCNQQEFLP